MTEDEFLGQHTLKMSDQTIPKEEKKDAQKDAPVQNSERHDFCREKQFGNKKCDTCARDSNPPFEFYIEKIKRLPEQEKHGDEKRKYPKQGALKKGEKHRKRGEKHRRIEHPIHEESIFEKKVRNADKEEKRKCKKNKKSEKKRGGVGR